MNFSTSRLSALARPAISALSRAKNLAANALMGSRQSRVEIMPGRAEPGSIETALVPADFDRIKLRSDFFAFKDEILNAIGNHYLLAVPMEAISIVEKHSSIMGIDHSFLFEMGPILAGIRDKVPEEVLSVNSFRLEIFLQAMGRSFTPKESTVLDIVTEIAKEAGYKGIKHLTEVPGVTIYYPDGKIVEGGKVPGSGRDLIK